jgi:hypothetical protein
MKKNLYAETWSRDLLSKIIQSEPRLEAMCGYFREKLSGLGIKNPQDFLTARLVYLVRVKNITKQWDYLHSMVGFPMMWQKVFNQIVAPPTDRYQEGLFKTT